MSRKSLRGLGADLYAPGSEDQRQPTSTPAHQHDGDAAAAQAKATFYLSPETLNDLDRAWLAQRGRDRRVSKSSIVERALREFLSRAAAA
jgi:hypothetical protein